MPGDANVVAAAGQGPDAPAPAAGGGVPFTLNGRPATAGKGEMLISAAERAGVYIPRFCYHPRMKSVGVCRMCLVEVSGPRGATLQPACFIAVAEGMEVDTTSDKVHKAQDGVLEFLLVNHPLDCPVCDKGGECPLQDQTLAYGPGESRFVEEKRHFEKPVAISDLVLLDRERCIQCSRCTRFADEVAGEALIDFAGRGERVEVATFPTEPFSSYFSGNTVQICPVGALTATPYRFTARPWDLDQVESTCTTCAFGCRVAVQSSVDRLTRLLGIDSDPVNHGWMCDKGRFVFEAVNGDEVAIAEPGAPVQGQFLGEAHETGHLQRGRLTDPLVRKGGAGNGGAGGGAGGDRGGELVTASWGEALSAAASALRDALASGGPRSVAFLGGAQLTNESQYAWAKLAKGVLGTDSVDAQTGDGLPAELLLSLPRATIDEACAAPVVVVLSGDLREELPVLFLRLRKAAVDGGTRLVEIAPRTTSLTRYATASLLTRPGDAPTFARALAGDEAAARSLGSHPEGATSAPEAVERARQLVAGAGSADEPPGTGVVVVLGRPSLAESAGVVAEAAAVLAAALPGATFLPALRRANVMGSLDMGLAPGVLPGRVGLGDGTDWFASAWGSVPADRGLDAEGILRAAAGEGADEIKALVLLGCDPLSDFPDRQLAEAALRSVGTVIAVAGHPSASTAVADVVLPAAVAHERIGTTTNIEGRVARLGQKIVPPGFAWADWMIAAELAAQLGADLGVASVAELWDEIAALSPAHAGITRALLEASPDGVLARAVGQGGGGAARPPGPSPVAPIDPMSLPGIESVERQGAPPWVGLAAPADEQAPAASAGGPGELGAAAGGGTESPRPPVLQGPPPPPAEPIHVPPPDSYGLRLVTTRHLYDAGSAVTRSPSLAPLVPTLTVRANPYDLDRLGVGTGDRVRVRSRRGELVLAAHADAGVPRGVVAMGFNLPGDPEAGGPSTASLIDAASLVTEVLLESVP